MTMPSPPKDNRDALRAQIVGLGDRTLRKSYFPQLQSQIEELKKARAQAEASEKKFRTLADFTNDMEYWIGPDGQIIYISPSCERLTGYCQSEFVAHPELLTTIVLAEDRPLVALHDKGADLIEPHRTDLRIVTRAGKIKWVAHVCQAIIGDNGEWLGRRGSNSDITARKADEAKIHRLSNLYSALSQCNQAIVRCTSQSALFQQICTDAVRYGGMKMAWIGMTDARGSIVSAASYGDLTGFLHGLQISVNCSTALSRDPVAASICEDRPIWSHDFLHDPSTAQYRLRARDAGFHSSASLPLHRNGVPVGCLTLYAAAAEVFDDQARDLLTEMAFDISFALDNFEREAQRKQVLEAVRAAEEQFRGLVELSIAGIYILQDERFVYANPRVAEILGCDSADELIGVDPLTTFVTTELPPEFRRLMNGDAAAGSFTLTVTRKDGLRIDLGLHGARATHAGRPAIIGMMQDISEKVRAEEQIRHYLGQLENSFMQTVLVATRLSELRDPYTAGHEQRVGTIAKAIAAEYGLDQHRIKGVEVAGYLHDLGKITIPAEILAKPGKLSSVEYLLIQGHAQASYNVLRDAQFPWPVAEIVLQHHERMDGSGYPQGLQGEEILLEARILAVADVLEAMGSHRPYRPSRGIEAALAEIVSGRGKLYDADVVDVCLRLFREKGFTLPE